METVVQRFLRYVSMDTTSDEFSDTCPSTPNQKKLGKILAEEMRAMGILDAKMDENGYVYGTVPGDESLPTVGLIAHMDTAPDASGADIKPKVVFYQGGDILLNPEKDIWLRESEYESLKRNHGKHLIVTDGTTLLGADDKAGVAEILTAAQELVSLGYRLQDLPALFGDGPLSASVLPYNRATAHQRLHLGREYAAVDLDFLHDLCGSGVLFLQDLEDILQDLQ